MILTFLLTILQVVGYSNAWPPKNPRFDAHDPKQGFGSGLDPYSIGPLDPDP